MEFKKREVKRRERPEAEQDKNGGLPEPPPKYSFDGKMLVVSVVCEAFDMVDVNMAESKCPVASIGRNYMQETRQRNMMYDIDSPEKLRSVTRYWNEWRDIKSGRKVKFAIHKKTTETTEAVK